MTDGKTECTFLWQVENYSYCWHKNGEELISPKFTADGFEGTVWKLVLYPRGSRQIFPSIISLYLHRCEDDDGPVEFSVEYQMSIRGENGLSVSRSTTHSFEKGQTCGWSYSFLKTDVVLQNRKGDYLPQDTLRVECKVWKGEGDVREAKEITARTRIGIQEISFIHLTESFSQLHPNEKKIIKTRSELNKQWDLVVCLCFGEDTSGGKITLEITPSDKSHILARCKISLVDRNGEKIECDNRLDNFRMNIPNLTLSLTRQAILDNESDYLPGDNLSLHCECVFSTGVEYEKIEKKVYEKPLVAFSEISNAEGKGINNASEKLSACPGVIDHLKAIYNNQLYTDVKLKTATQSFPAHKVWLCARSPVFETMMSSDMREKNTNIIPIDDLEDDTLQQFLAFLYTDEVEDVCWESAIKLYYAADKYQVEKLKAICSAFLVENVTTTSVCELLVLADTHSDSDLKNIVEDFIFEHEIQVFRSEEWNKLAKLNSELALQTMLRNYNRKMM